MVGGEEWWVAGEEGEKAECIEGQQGNEKAEGRDSGRVEKMERIRAWLLSFVVHLSSTDF